MLGSAEARKLDEHAVSLQAVYAKHGTNVDTRLTVIDRVPADEIASVAAFLLSPAADLLGTLPPGGVYYATPTPGAANSVAAVSGLIGASRSGPP